MGARATVPEAPHAVVTGASRGIGAAIARALICSGARVSLLARDAEKLRDVAASVESAASAVHVNVVRCDVADVGAVHSAIARARERFGPVHILVNCAGQADSASFLETDETLWQRMLSVNLTGVFLCTREVLPDMLRGKYGRIVNIASTAGLRGYPYVTAYVASKHGVVGLTRALAIEVADKQVTVNAVCPGYTETDLIHRAIERIAAKIGRSHEEAQAQLLAANPQHRFIQPEEVARVVVWLCAPGSGSITGQSIAVAGGEVM